MFLLIYDGETMADNRIRVALTGNPNVGKTTLFNVITGSRQHVGNWPGVTVEKKSGFKIYKGYEIEVIDLPGTYSLTAYSLDEVVARDFIVDEKPDVVVQIVDATNIERNLYLTTQLMELGSKMIIALNMYDLAEERGDKLHVEKMEKILAMPVVLTIASDNVGIYELLDTVIAEKQKENYHSREIGYGDEIESRIIELEKVLSQDKGLASRYPLRWLAVRLLDGDENILRKIAGSSVAPEIKSILARLDIEEYEALMADKRYEIISAMFPQMCERCMTRMTTSDMIDRVMTNKYLGIPIFLALMWGAFELTFSFANPFMAIIEMIFVWLGEVAAVHVRPEWLASLIGEGIIGGVGSVFSFIPNIFILFFLLSMLEDSGYLARAAFIVDRVMYKIGLQGKSFIPMLLGFGCNVPAIMSTRSIEDRMDRMATIMVVPFISCGARLPIYILFAGTFFSKNAGTVIFCIYLLGILVAVASAKLLRTTALKGHPAPFILELPPYRVPTLKNSINHMWDNGSMYIRKAGTIILGGSVVIWLLAALPWGVEYGSEDSFIGIIGHAIQPLLDPLGFDWKISVSLLFGFVAKEIVVASLGVLYGVGDDQLALTDSLLADPNMYSITALSIMVFSLLYMPCVAVVGIIKKETGSWKWTAFSVVYGLVVAWILAFVVFQGGKLLN